MSMQMYRGRRPALRFNLEKNPWDQAVRRLSEERFSVRTIAIHTGLSESQVYYRQQVMGICLHQSRNGLTVETRLILKAVARELRSIEALKRSGYIGRGIQGYKIRLAI